MKLSFIFAAMTLSGCATLQERCEESWRDVVERTKARTSVDCSITHEDFSEHIWSLKRQYETKICPGVLPASYDDELVSWYTQKNDLKQRIAVRVQDSDRDIQFSLPYVSLIIAHTEDRGVVFEGEVESLATGVLDKEKALIVDLNDSVRFYTLRVNGQGNRQGVAFTNLYYIGQRDVFTERFGVLEMPVYSPNKSSVDADEEEEIRVEIARLQKDLQAVQAKIDDRHKLRDQQTEEASKCQSEKHGLWREEERLDRLQYKYNICKELRESLPQCRSVI